MNWLLLLLHNRNHVPYIFLLPLENYHNNIPSDGELVRIAKNVGVGFGD
jgi:hypothetical protein